MRKLKAFFSGIGSVIDIFGADDVAIPYGGFETDARKLAADWQVIGKDMQSAIDKVKVEIDDISSGSNP